MPPGRGSHAFPPGLPAVPPGHGSHALPPGSHAFPPGHGRHTFPPGLPAVPPGFPDLLTGHGLHDFPPRPRGYGVAAPPPPPPRTVDVPWDLLPGARGLYHSPSARVRHGFPGSRTDVRGLGARGVVPPEDRETLGHCCCFHPGWEGGTLPPAGPPPLCVPGSEVPTGGGSSGGDASTPPAPAAPVPVPGDGSVSTPSCPCASVTSDRAR